MGELPTMENKMDYEVHIENSAESAQFITARTNGINTAPDTKTPTDETLDWERFQLYEKGEMLDQDFLDIVKMKMKKEREGKGEKEKTDKEKLIDLIDKNPTLVHLILQQVGGDGIEMKVETAVRIKAVRMTRKSRMQESCVAQGKDIILDLLIPQYDAYLAWCKKEEQNRGSIHRKMKEDVNYDKVWNRFYSFSLELTSLICLILDEDFASEEPKYLRKNHKCTSGGDEKTEGDEGKMATVLHFAASRNLTEVMKKILAQQSNMWECEDEAGKIPLHHAIKKSQDDAASLLIQHMPNARVREFLNDGSQRDVKYSKFAEIIKDGVRMPKTVEAILDSCIDRDWSALVPRTENSALFPTSQNCENCPFILPNTANCYNFHYDLLDHGEKKSCLRRLVGGNCDKNLYNPYHAWKQKPWKDHLLKTLNVMEIYTMNQDPLLQHPVVQMLMRSKWNRYARAWVYKILLISIVFLLLLTLAFFLKSSTHDRRSYKTNLDYVRLVCEVLSLLIVLGYTWMELMDFVKHKRKYFMKLTNVFDVISCVLILFVVFPLRVVGGHMGVEFTVSAVAYLISFVRISYMACLVSKFMSIYVTALYSMVIKEISRFLVLFIIFMFAFGGSVYLALKGSLAYYHIAKYGNESNTHAADVYRMKNNTSLTKGYFFSLLQEVRALTEAGPYSDTDEYLKLETGVLVLLMINMFCGIIILDNIFIGQIGNAYASAMEKARIQYDVGRVKVCTYIEDSWFTCCTAKRDKYNRSEELLSEEELQHELGDDWNAFKLKVGGQRST